MIIEESVVFGDNSAFLNADIQAIGFGAEMFSDWSIDANDAGSLISGELTAFV